MEKCGIGLLLIISGPAGSGKGTVIKNLLESSDEFYYSVSMTTREPRFGEIGGAHYYFVTSEEFKARINAGDMFEYEEYSGNYYGTPKKNILEMIERGKTVILEIEVKGALNVMKKYDCAVSVFILPPDFKTLENRLRFRGTESEAEIEKRLRIAEAEIEALYSYDYVIVNYDGEPEITAAKIKNIVSCEKLKTKRHPELKNNFLNKK